MVHMNMTKTRKRIFAKFFKQGTGKEPVRDWLMALPKGDRKTIGEDIKTVEYGWPIGMPVCRQLTNTSGLYEVRSNISSNRIARVIFSIHKNQMILLHGFIKKTQATPDQDKNLAKRRNSAFEHEEKQRKKVSKK